MKPKRLISLLVAVCMMITMLPLSAVTAFAADTSSSTGTAIVDGYKYDYEVDANGNATITKFLGPVDSEGNVDSTNDGPYNITIPDKLGGCPVTGLGDHSFAAYPISIRDNYENPLCSNIHSVTIPQSVTSIGYEAFCYCKNLQSLTLEGSIESMGDGAFAYCTSLKTFPLVGNIQKIGDYTFYRCDDLENVTIPESVTSIGKYAFEYCDDLGNVTIPQSITSIGDYAFENCNRLKLTTPSFGEKLQTIGKYAFSNCFCPSEEVTIPQSVTSIGDSAFSGCYGMRSFTINNATTSIGGWAFDGCWSLTTLKLGAHITTIGNGAFYDCHDLDNVTIPQSVTSIGKYAFEKCHKLSTITIPEKVEKIESETFDDCWKLKSITLPAGLTSFEASLDDCPDDCVIYYNGNEHAADTLRKNNPVLEDAVQKGHQLLYRCNVTFDANGGNPTDHAVVSAYKTEKINANDLKAIPNPTRAGYNFTGWYTEKGQPFDVNEIITKNMTEDITFYAHWEPAPKAPVCHPLTVTGGIVTVKNGDKDVTDTLTVTPGATTGQKTYSVPEGAEVTVTLDKNTVHNGKVFDGWSTTGNLSLLTGQDYKAESITFRMNSDVNVSAKYRDAAADHTHDTAVCHPLTVTGGIVTVKNGDKDVTDTLTVTTDETTGKKTYSVPDGATVTVTLDKTLIPEGMVFDIWSTGKFSLPLGQDYKAESITFTMSNMSSDVDIAAQYRDASIEDDGPGVLGTAAIIGTAAVGTAVLGYQAYSLGTEFAGKLMALPYFPSNRSALAMMLWEDAGNPMPESELLYPDVEQEEQDMDLQHAARWAMENELIPDLNDEGTAPEEMKFFPANPVSKLDVLNAWQKAQELKNN